jgi:outer membrane biosynthesis protein TonB
MAMDRAEKLGLGAAIGGHVILLGAFAFGMLASAETVTKREAISVSLVGEIADVSTAPDAIQEESAPPAPGEIEPAEPPPAPTPVMQMERPVEKQQTKPVPKPTQPDVAPPVAKVAAKKEPVKRSPAKAETRPVKIAAATPKTTNTAATSGKGSTPAKTVGLSRSFEDSINNIGKAPGAGKAIGTPAAKTATEVKRSVTALLGPQIQRRVEGCAPTGIELNKIITKVTLNLDPSGRLVTISYGGQTGITDSNRPQADPLKQCILQAVRAASPFSNLDPDYYDVWKSHAMGIKGKG